MRHAAYIAGIVACLLLSVFSWYESFAPGHPSATLFYVGIGTALAAVILAFMWRIPTR